MGYNGGFTQFRNSVLLLISTITLSCASGVGGNASNDSNATDSQNGGAAASDSVDWSVPPLNLAEGTTVGKFSVETSSADFFVLHGTLPIPPALFPRADGQIPFAIRDCDGTLVPAQTEIVSRYANETYGADVVELIAWVRRNPAVAAGTMADYPIVISYYTPQAAVAGSAANRLLQTYAIPETLQQLLQNGGPLKLRSEDFFGNRYEIDLLAGAGSVRQVHQGLTMNQVVTYGTMMPVAGNPQLSKQLPYLFGVHAYLTSRSGEEGLSLELRINNAPSNLTGQLDKPLGDLYFKNLELVLPLAWNARQQAADPFFRNAYVEGTSHIIPIVDTIKDNDDQIVYYKETVNGVTTVKSYTLDMQAGQMHLIPERFHFHRRLALVSNGNEAAADRLLNNYGLGFAQAGVNQDGVTYYSWWNPQTAAYIAQKNLVPKLEHIGGGAAVNELQQLATEYENLLKTGLQSAGSFYPVTMPVLGAFHMFGVAYQGETGGSFLGYFPGADIIAASSRLGINAAQLNHRMNDNRQANGIYNLDGSPLNRTQWEKTGIVTKKYVNFDFFMGPQGSNDPFGYAVATNSHIAAVTSAGKQPGYEAELKGFQPHDGQHLRRYTRNALALTWITNDALAKDDLNMQAELVYLTIRDIANAADQLKTQSTTMLAHAVEIFQLPINKVIPDDLHELTAKPIGFDAGRQDGWGFDTMAAYYSLASLDWRHERLHWFEFAVDVFAAGQSVCNGLFGRKVYSKILGGQYQATQTYEEDIILNGLFGIYQSVFEYVDADRMTKLENMTRTALYSMTTTAIWSDAKKGPLNQIAVADLNSDHPYYLGGGAIPSFCSAFPAAGVGDDGYVYASYAWPAFGYAYQLSGDVFFLQKAAQMLQVSGDPLSMGLSQVSSTMLNKFASDGTKDNDWRASVIALVEQF